MQIPFQQTNQVNYFNSRFVSNTYKTKADQSLLTRRRMLEAQEEAKETEAVKVTISAEAMELSRQVKEMERAQQAQAVEKTSGVSESAQLTDQEIYDELIGQVRFWGDQAANIRNRYDHEETKEMAEERAAALTQLQKLEELQKSETVKLEKDAQKAAELASLQQEEINKKNSELIMMIESFEDQNDDDEAEGQDGESDTSQEETDSRNSLMEGEIGAYAAKKELGMLGTIDAMEQSGTEHLADNDQSIRGLLDERKNIYRLINDHGTDIKEKIEAMSNYVGTLANHGALEEDFKKRIESESDEKSKEKLRAMSDYFLDLDYKNQIESLAKDRAHALQERINARDLRIAHLGSRHLVMAEQQKKELQSLFDEDDIMRAQGQGGITSRTEEIAERLQDKLDERDHIDEDSAPEEEIREKEDQQEEENKSEETENAFTEREQSDEAELWSGSIQSLILDGRRFAEMKGLLA
ncbi:MAG: hypothetical protein K2I96_18910 [Lachnospiraceae bacterium]|nr:hypothetical protein [Lachnospiraceae bacterium]